MVSDEWDAAFEEAAKIVETHPARFAGQTEEAVRAALAAAIRAQKQENIPIERPKRRRA
jgi:hypothetical protein